MLTLLIFSAAIHKSEEGVSSLNYSLSSTVAPEATEADDSADEVFNDAEESLIAKMGRYALRCLQRGSLYLPRLIWNPAGVTDHASAVSSVNVSCANA